MSTSCPSPMKSCFITGEQCTNKNNIDRIRDANFKQGIVSVFVVMPFTDMTKASYDSIIKPALEKMNDVEKLLLLSKKETEQTHTIISCNNEEEKNKYITKCKENKTIYMDVKRVNVERSDHDAMFGYIICNRVCQQIQIADIVVVDVSKGNPNVFYELGLSMALKKFIIPICFEDDYEKEYDSGKNALSNNESAQDKNKLWKDKLFYYLSIAASSYKSKDKQLCESLLLYNSGGFMSTNFKEVIKNYYKTVRKLDENSIFKGDRIGVLAQDQYILEKDKENSFKKSTRYDVSDILLFGVNQASRNAEQHMIKPSKPELPANENTKKENPILEDFLNIHAENQGILLYTHDPLKGNSPENSFFTKLIGENKKENYKNTFEKMIEALNYVYQIVVDTEDNDVFSLFWLGIAHGFGAYAVRIIRNYTNEELQEIEKKMKENKENSDNQNKDSNIALYTPRSIFDVSGLWTAEIRADKLNEFYTQLRTVELGIARHRKLLPSTTKNNLSNVAIKGDIAEYIKDITKEINNHKLIDCNSFESYYRRKLWRALLTYDKLHLIIGSGSYSDTSADKSSDDKSKKLSEGELKTQLGDILQKLDDKSSIRTIRMSIGDWDYQSVSLFTEYMSAHNTVGKYIIREFPHSSKDDTSRDTYREAFLYRDNIISIGDNTVNPVSQGIIKHIEDNYVYDDIHKKEDDKVEDYKAEDYKAEDRKCEKCKREKCKRDSHDGIHYRKFSSKYGELSIKWNQPTAFCINCQNYNSGYRGCRFAEYTPLELNCPYIEENKEGQKICPHKDNISKCEHMNGKKECPHIKYSTHKSYAQLIILKSLKTTEEEIKTTEEKKEKDNEYFEVLIGGGAGPATFALASLFVNEDIKYIKQMNKTGDTDTKNLLKDKIFGDTEDFLLVKLQNIIRDKILTQFEKELRTKYWKGISVKRKDNNIDMTDNIIDMTVDYLRILLSKFFLPMLYKKDIDGIKKSLQLFVYKFVYKYDIEYKFKNTCLSYTPVSKDIDNVLSNSIISVIKTTIEHFDGIEVIFEVDVTHTQAGKRNNNDSKAIEDRAVHNMSIARYTYEENEKKEKVNYKIVENTPENKSKDALDAVFFIWNKDHIMPSETDKQETSKNPTNEALNQPATNTDATPTINGDVINNVTPVDASETHDSQSQPQSNPTTADSK